MLVLLSFCFSLFISSGQAQVSCDLVRCAQPICPPGVLPIKDPSGCCKICTKRREGESCGGSTNGVCDDHLFCKITNSYSNYGICERITSDCQSLSDSGPCKAYFTKWFFNHITKLCQEFIYGGCGGNNNRYDSKVSCERACAYN